MTTCINRDLSIGVDGAIIEVLDWYNRKTCQQKQSVLTRVAFRPCDIKRCASGVELCWVPGYIRCDAVFGRAVPTGRVQGKVVAWSGEGDNNRGWWASTLWSCRMYSSLIRITKHSKSVTAFIKREPTQALPVMVKAGFGITHFKQAAPNIHWGISANFPRSLTASLCADVYRRWTASISYCFSIFTASARFAGNVATKADSVFEVAAMLKIHHLWDLLSDGSSAHVSWTVEGIAAGVSLYLDSGAVKSDKGTHGGMPVCLSFNALYPIGQPLGAVEPSMASRRPLRFFFGLELRPWLAGSTHSEHLLEEDPFANPPPPPLPPPLPRRTQIDGPRHLSAV